MGLNLIKSKAVSSAASPIGVVEFAKSLLRTVPVTGHANGGNHGKPQREIGLAISGGVDSMALALLCSRLKDLPESNYKDVKALRYLKSYNFRAFVVDHAVRKGSREEAQTVVEVLRRRAEVLTFQWSPQDGNNPAAAPNFESLARKHRFQTLGSACYRHGINALLLAHHQDDQAETLLMRLINGHKMLGLTGMKAMAGIPECHGVYGVHDSGEIRDVPTSEVNTQQLQMADGGVRVYRPLLGFSKARLRTTCEEAELEWFEDHTNSDPTLTMRNAVRKLYSTHNLPLALRKPSMLALSEKAKDKHKLQEHIMHKMLAGCKISRFDNRSGILRLRFPDLGKVDGLKDFNTTEQLRMPATMLLRRIINIVTPNEHVELTTLTNMLPTIFPETYAKDMKQFPSTVKQTIAGVQFDPVLSDDPLPKPEWLLSRQNHPNPKQSFLLHAIKTQSQLWTPWSLIDGRYWLRIKDDIVRSFTVEPLRPHHLGDFVSMLNEEKRRCLKADLRKLAPGNIRWTLTAVSREGKVVALPSLGYMVGGESLQWEIIYKKVDLDGLTVGVGKS